MTKLRGVEPDPHSGRNGLRAVDGRAVLRTDRRRPLSTTGRVAPYRLLVENGVDVFSRHDRAGRFLDASPAATDVLGRAPKDVVGASWRDLVHRDDRDRFEGWWHTLHGGSGAILTFRVDRPDGSVVRVETAACAGVLPDDRLFEVQALTRAAPALVSADARARQHRELELRAAQLDRANRDLARFAADTAHDLRAPLQAISGFAQLLARREGHRLDETSQQALAYILAAAGDMGAIVESALDHANPMVGHTRPGFVDSTDMAIRAVQRLRSEIEAAGASVEVEELPPVFGNAAQLGRVLQNLVSNALKAAVPGRPVHVAVSGRAVPGGWEVSVADNGIGIPHRNRQRVFSTLEACPPGRTTQPRGRGLSICKAIVERHGGRIWVDDPPGQGTRVTFYLPEAPAPPLGRASIETGAARDGAHE